MDAVVACAKSIFPPTSKTAADEYDFLHVLARGVGGDCHILQSRKTRVVVVRKYLAEHAKKSYEIKALTKWLLPHDNIVQGYEAFKEAGLPVLTMEFCCGGDLQQQMDYLALVAGSREERGRLVMPEGFALHVLLSMFQALAYVHHGLMVKGTSSSDIAIEKHRCHKKLVHADVKPGNIFMRWSATPQCRGLPDIVLGDFGLCMPAKRSVGVAGTVQYMAPEVQRIRKLRDNDFKEYVRLEKAKDVVTRASDVYSLGLCIVRLCGDNQFRTGHLPSAVSPRTSTCQSLLIAVRACLELCPTDRPRMDDSTNGVLKMFLGDLLDERLVRSQQPVDLRYWALPPVEAYDKA